MINTASDDWKILQSMLSDASVDSTKQHIKVQMTGTIEGQTLKGDGTVPVQDSVDLLAYFSTYRCDADAITAKVSSPMCTGIYLLIDHTNPAAVHFFQALMEGKKGNITFHYVKNVTGSKREKYGSEEITDARVLLVYMNSNASIGPYVFLKLLPTVTTITVDKASHGHNFHTASTK